MVRCRRLTSSSASVPRGPGGVDPGPPQDLVGQEVADAGDAVLIEQHGLDRRPHARTARKPAGDG